VLLRVQAIKDEAEIPYILKTYSITEDSLKKALEASKAGMSEWEIEAIARSNMVLSGSEGMPYPAWVCSGPNTRLSLARSTEKTISKDELVQLTIGTKYMGYCGNMCRPFAIGKFPEPAKKLADVALEAMHYVLDNIKPGVNSSDMFRGYYNILSKYGYENYTLYGPAHGTGSSEVEGLWLSEDSDFIVEKNMLFNIDIWLSDDRHGLRFEDGILITEDGVRELTSYKREVIVL
jgi:Xaa-Pro aminopeptidase